MAEYFGPGVSQTLSAAARQFTAVVWQMDKPPLDAELNLMSQMEWESLSETVRSQVHSGFFLDPTRCEGDYLTDSLYANQFFLAPPATVNMVEDASPGLIAVVNGWVFPVAGTDNATAANRIRLYPPPTTDSRTDFVFLEVWQTLVSPNPSTVNKPDAANIYKYGNTQYGGANITDDLEDPSIGFETTKRVQLQYRIRVMGSGDSGGTSIDLANYPDGLTDPQVLGQGTAASPLGGFTFTNMRQELGDPSLWRAGDGLPPNALGTVDGYVYAIPLCGVFRRNTGAFTAIATSGNPNQNGGTERTPSSHGLTDPRNGATTLTQATLLNALDETLVGFIDLNDYTGSALGDANLFPIGTLRRYLVIGTGIDAEIIAIDQNVLGGNGVYINLLGRGRGGTMAKNHPAGTPVSLYNVRPDNLYSDQIAPTDILDMRRSVNFGDWDYNRLLQKGVSALVQNNLRSAFKKAGTGGDTEGPVTTEVSYFQTVTVGPPNHVGAVDGTDGLRTVWSDSAAIQRDVTVVLDPATASNASHITNTTFDATIAPSWAVGADFQPNGFLNYGGDALGWTNGSVIFMDIGGADGKGGAHGGLLNSQEAVRFVAPYEAWKPGDDELASHHPWALRFIGGVPGNTFGTPGSITSAQNGYRAGAITTPAGIGESLTDHPGPMFPVRSTNFERPFIVLGGVLNPALRFTGVVASNTNLVNIGSAPTPPALYAQYEINISSINWNTFGESTLLLGRDQKTLREYLTNDGQDFTGKSSRLYLVVYGDPANRDNNGAFQVIGAGTAARTGGAFTQNLGATPNRLVVRALSKDFAAFIDNPGNTVTIEFRSQDINAEDDNGRTSPPQGVAVVITDLHAADLPWFNSTNPIAEAMSIVVPVGYLRVIPVASKATLTTDILWSPSHGASPRVPDRVVRFASINSAATFVRSPVSATDPGFITDTGYPSGDLVYPPTQVQLWNRLPSNGLAAPYAPAYGGAVVGLTEQDREAELFVDPGSKTVVFRPFIKKPMILKGFNTVPGGSTSLIGSLTYVNATVKDSLALFTPSKTLGYTLPPEYTPRFGRQDIPYHLRTGTTDPVYPGINHLFADGATLSNPVFYIVGGVNNPGPVGTALVQSLLFGTNAGIAYCANGTIGGAPHTAYGARKTYLPDVVSSDLGRGMWGVELPPYLGVARLYGVYELADFLAHLDPTFVGAFQNDRVTPITNAPVNLLRTDASKQTLFIRQNGGNAVTGLTDSHTYLVPDSAIDFTLAPTYAPGDTFNTFNYVVECVVFGFAEGFINKNSYVLARRSTGTAVAVADVSTPELVGVDMILPSAAPRGDNLYEVYDRTVYQGDPYMTRDGSTIQQADYGTRYGQIPQASAFQLATAINQTVVETPNPRSLEVLATMDFYTTLGTGKIGGAMYPSTLLDCGYISPASVNAAGDSRIPDGLGQLPWRVETNAFTAGQNKNSSHATVTIQLLDLNLITSTTLNVIIGNSSGVLATFVAGISYGTGGPVSLTAMALTLALAINGTGGAPTIITSLVGLVSATAIGETVLLTAVQPGALGNGYYVSLRLSTFPVSTYPSVATIARLLWGSWAYPTPGSTPLTGVVTQGNFRGGVDLPVNGGNGNSVISLTGMTERLPLGILVSDSDFIAENILGDGATSLRSYQGGIRSVYENVPLTTNGSEFTRFLGEPGSVLSMSDGGVLQYTPYTTGPSGALAFRLYRGGGAAFVQSGDAPGGPVTWVSDSFAAAVRPVLKGAILACKAVLVRNYHEDAFGLSSIRSEGDEIQMMVFTQAVYGTVTTTDDGVTLSGVISPTGYGEGYAAADRYRLPGLPMDRGRTRTIPNPNATPAPYNG